MIVFMTIIFSSNERISKTRICDIKWVRGKICFCYRDPSLITTKRDTRISRLAYGVIGHWTGLKAGPYEIIRVSWRFLFIIFVNLCLVISRAIVCRRP